MNDTYELRAKLVKLRLERDEARYNARILAHAYEHDTRPPSRVVVEALAYPADSRGVGEA